MAASRRATYLFVFFGLLGGIVAALAPGPPPRPGSTGPVHVVRRPAGPSSLAGAPPEVREFLGRVFEKVPDNGTGVAGAGSPGGLSPGLPQIRTCGFPASGSSSQDLATRLLRP